MASQLLLFRQEAIEFQRHNQQWGQAALLQPLSTKVMTWFIAAAVALVITFLFLAQYARKETVIGYLDSNRRHCEDLRVSTGYD